jgi:uracil-DNA glycosylase family 4
MNAWANWENDFEIARAALAWQVELGVDEAICDAPVNRFELPAAAPERPTAPAAAPAAAPTAATPAPAQADPVAEAEAAARAAPDLAALQEALAAFPHCDLQLGARNLVFCDGQENARVMIVGEAPGREEDRQGKPFVGEAGQLLDRMFSAISMGRAHPDPARALYITNILPWRPPQNRDPSLEERAMFRPFVLRHIELAAPDIVVLMGRISAMTLLDTAEGITKIRGQWRELAGRPALPMLHPAYLLRNPAAKREAWADLLALQARLRGDG